jgi:hypothetical protein
MQLTVVAGARVLDVLALARLAYTEDVAVVDPLDLDQWLFCLLATPLQRMRGPAEHVVSLRFFACILSTPYGVLCSPRRPKPGSSVDRSTVVCSCRPRRRRH